jgi:hypothetical protein
MRSNYHEIQACIAKDCDSVPIPGLKQLARRIRSIKRHQLPDATRLLLETPQSPEATELFLGRLIWWTSRQIGGSVAIGPTFVRTVSELGEDVLAALPAHTRTALKRLADRAAKDPIEVSAFDRIAHALAIDGALCEWLGTEVGETKPKQASPQQIYRKLAQQMHPDRGGNPEAMAALNELWRAVKQSA